MLMRLAGYIRFFWFALSANVFVLALVWFYLGVEAALLATLLVILEVTFSFENAVINARVLRHMSTFWQQVFLTVGILVAVFGMRIVFPILLVAITAQLPMDAVLRLALNEPEAYSNQLEHAMPAIAAFGGIFLLLVFLNYFIFENNNSKWLNSIENIFEKLPKRWYSAPLLALTVLIFIAVSAGKEAAIVCTAGIIGVATYLIIHSLVTYMQSRHVGHTAAKMTGMAGLLGFLYLEVLDASFSLDGVIGAFAITTSVVLIAAGLGAGAVWVRSMTVYLVRHETLGKYVFLEQGAHYAIGLLALVLLLHPFIDIPEFVTGLAGVCIIVMAIIASIKTKAHGLSSRRQKKLARSV